MKNKLIKAAAVISFVLIAAPYFVLASTNPIKSDVFDPTILAGPLLICTGVPTSGGAITNTCQNLCDLVAQIENIIYFMIAVIIWIITPILVTVGGLRIMMSGGSHGIEEGKKTITGAVIGVVIVLCSYLIIGTFVGFLGIKGIGGFGTSSCNLQPGSATTPTTFELTY